MNWETVKKCIEVMRELQDKKTNVLREAEGFDSLISNEELDVVEELAIVFNKLDTKLIDNTIKVLEKLENSEVVDDYQMTQFSMWLKLHSKAKEVIHLMVDINGFDKSIIDRVAKSAGQDIKDFNQTILKSAVQGEMGIFNF